MKPLLVFVQALFLLLATGAVVGAFCLVFISISNGVSAKMMASFEQEPAQGWDYWKWHFIKQSMWGNLGAISILVFVAFLVWRGWVAFARSDRRRRLAQRNPGKDTALSEEK